MSRYLLFMILFGGLPAYSDNLLQSLIDKSGRVVGEESLLNIERQYFALRHLASNCKVQKEQFQWPSSCFQFVHQVREGEWASDMALQRIEGELDSWCEIHFEEVRFGKGHTDLESLHLNLETCRRLLTEIQRDRIYVKNGKN